MTALKIVLKYGPPTFLVGVPAEKAVGLFATIFYCKMAIKVFPLQSLTQLDLIMTFSVV